MELILVMLLQDLVVQVNHMVVGVVVLLLVLVQVVEEVVL
jgi:hypothetical protein